MNVDDVLTLAHQRLAVQPDMSQAGETYSDNCLAGLPAALESTRAFTNLPYGEHPAQKLDLFLPTEGEGPWPVMVFFHGGGWTNGTKEWNAFMAPVLTQAGIALVSPSYRLLPEVHYPVPMEDCAKAIRWVVGHAEQRQLDSKRLVLAGHSAGGQIAALLCADPAWLNAAEVPTANVLGCYAVSATFNRRNVSPAIGEEFVQPGPTEAIQPDSPIALASNAFTDFRLVWGNAENPRVATTGRLMEEQLLRSGRKVETEVIEGGDHFSMHLDHSDPKSRLSVALQEWLRRVEFI